MASVTNRFSCRAFISTCGLLSHLVQCVLLRCCWSCLWLLDCFISCEDCLSFIAPVLTMSNGLGVGHDLKLTVACGWLPFVKWLSSLSLMLISRTAVILTKLCPWFLQRDNLVSFGPTFGQSCTFWPTLQYNTAMYCSAVLLSSIEPCPLQMTLFLTKKLSIFWLKSYQFFWKFWSFYIHHLLLP